VRPIWLAVALSALLLVGCTGGGGTPSTSSVTAAVRPASTAKISIISPKEGTVVHGSSTTLHVDLVGGKIVSVTSTDLKPNLGHIHVSVDGALVSMTTGTTLPLTNLTPGMHLVTVEFVATDHAPFNPRVIAGVSFKVAA
jgi:hypothetical protein